MSGIVTTMMLRSHSTTSSTTQITNTVEHCAVIMLIVAQQGNVEERLKPAVPIQAKSDLEKIFRFLLFFANNWLINDPDRQQNRNKQSHRSRSKRERDDYKPFGNSARL